MCSSSCLEDIFGTLTIIEIIGFEKRMTLSSLAACVDYETLLDEWYKIINFGVVRNLQIFWNLVIHGCLKVYKMM